MKGKTHFNEWLKVFCKESQFTVSQKIKIGQMIYHHDQYKEMMSTRLLLSVIERCVTLPKQVQDRLWNLGNGMTSTPKT